MYSINLAFTERYPTLQTPNPPKFQTCADYFILGDCCSKELSGSLPNVYIQTNKMPLHGLLWRFLTPTYYIIYPLQSQSHNHKIPYAFSPLAIANPDKIALNSLFKPGIRSSHSHTVSSSL